MPLPLLVCILYSVLSFRALPENISKALYSCTYIYAEGSGREATLILLLAIWCRPVSAVLFVRRLSSSLAPSFSSLVRFNIPVLHLFERPKSLPGVSLSRHSTSSSFAFLRLAGILLPAPLPPEIASLARLPLAATLPRYSSLSPRFSPRVGLLSCCDILVRIYGRNTIIAGAFAYTISSCQVGKHVYLIARMPEFRRCGGTVQSIRSDVISRCESIGYNKLGFVSLPQGTHKACQTNIIALFEKNVPSRSRRL